MKTNVQITAVKKEFKNGQNGYEVKVEGTFDARSKVDRKLDCKMNFHEPLKAMRYMFLLSKKLELQIDSIQLAALSLAYQRAKEAEQKAVEDAASAIAEVGDAEQDVDSSSPSGEDVKEVAPSTAEPTPILKQFQELKAKHPEAVLLFRCGDFYESYMEDAEICARVLGITLTKRSSDKVSMAGFPYHALDTYLPKLIRSGHRVAICDQIEGPKQREQSQACLGSAESHKELDNSQDPNTTKRLVKRGITDLVTPAESEEPAEPAAPKRRGRKPKAESSLFNEESAA